MWEEYAGVRWMCPRSKRPWKCARSVHCHGVPPWQVPQYVLEEASEKGRACSIIVTQPRRISAIGVSERVAAERGEAVGGVVGYSIRLESKSSAATCVSRRPPLERFGHRPGSFHGLVAIHLPASLDTHQSPLRPRL